MTAIVAGTTFSLVSAVLTVLLNTVANPALVFAVGAMLTALFVGVTVISVNDYQHQQEQEA